ncbi:MAG: hypothetical protein K0S34_2484 [Bacillales bacterium]|nr:hypothetical protein [Bacillales bacterium]
MLICAFGARFPRARPQLIFASFTCKNGFSARAVPAGEMHAFRAPPLQSTEIRKCRFFRRTNKNPCSFSVTTIYPEVKHMYSFKRDLYNLRLLFLVIFLSDLLLLLGIFNILNIG